MISKSGSDFDIILISAEYYDDHPLSPAGMIARVLEAEGFSVGIIEKPLSNSDFTRLGKPRLCFCVTSGSIDSMLNNYTPLKKSRVEDEHSNTNPMPDRAVTYYCNKLRELAKGVPTVIGGIEASLRRFAHYDYWENRVRKSLLLDTRADILVFGNGELQIIEIANRLKNSEPLDGIKGTCILRKERPVGFTLLPSFKDVNANDKDFCRMQALFSNRENLAQEYDNNYVLQHEYPQYTTADLDRIYSLPFTRTLSQGSLLGLAKFSVVTHRGCVGNCSFCSIALHQGDKIISRSEENILNEIQSLTKHPDFIGQVDDLGGPSANMYGMDCVVNCKRQCMECNTLEKSHSRLIGLMRKARSIPGVKKVFVRSGVRYDLALESKEYLRELSSHHISGCLKIAPEHFSEKVLKLMNKNNARFNEFLNEFTRINEGKGQELKYYLLIGHPGDDMAEVQKLAAKARQLKNTESFQFFTPTPMTVSTCMYYTGLNPFTLEPVKVVYDFHTKKLMKRLMLDAVGSDGKNDEKRFRHSFSRDNSSSRDHPSSQDYSSSHDRQSSHEQYSSNIKQRSWRRK